MAAAELIEALHDPSIYPEPTQHIEMHETHVSLVFVTRSVILDASFSQRNNRLQMAHLTDMADCLILPCMAPSSVIQNRLKAQANDPSHIADARIDLRPSFSRHYEPIDASEQASCLPIDTSQPLRSSCMQALGDIYQWRRNI